MDLNAMVARLKSHPRAAEMGMMAFHLGIVRAASRDGKNVKALEVEYDYDIVANIISNIKELPGIIEVLVETREGNLGIGEEILAVAVAGDVREHVFPALEEAVNRIKAEASKKKEVIFPWGW
ncbi:MAG: molybdenum cofactor biosynthesis protein MoaE [Deltaproteobacteria bacterium]|nr:molybdenum cofactor biosynthesis protein MoaE [Deltaproteobacteria bacterium]